MYNGADHWTAAETFKEYLQDYEKFGEYIIDFKYFLFDLNKAADEPESEMSALLDIVFMLDKKSSRQDIEKSLTKAFSLLDRLSAEDKEDMYYWIHSVWLSHIKDEKKKEELLKNFKRGEVSEMNSGLGFLFEEERAKAAKQAAKQTEKRTEKRVRKERNKQLIKKMIHRGDTIAEIADFLEINIEEIEKAKKELKL